MLCLSSVKAESVFYSRRKVKNCMSKTIMRRGTVGQVLEDKGQKERHQGGIFI